MLDVQDKDQKRKCDILRIAVGRIRKQCDMMVKKQQRRNGYIRMVQVRLDDVNFPRTTVTSLSYVP